MRVPVPLPFPLARIIHHILPLDGVGRDLGSERRPPRHRRPGEGAGKVGLAAVFRKAGEVGAEDPYGVAAFVVDFWGVCFVLVVCLMCVLVVV